MNQTKKRLQIINIAISITDIETIQLQMLKLASLRSDAKLKEILAGLQAQNYAQTQTLITEYIETPSEEIIQRTAQNDQEIIDQFDLFVTEKEETQEETELFDFDLLSKEVSDKDKLTETVQNIDFDNLLNLKAEDVMPNNIELDISQTQQDDFFNTEENNFSKTGKSHIDTDFIPKDTFFDTEEEKTANGENLLFQETKEQTETEPHKEESIKEPDVTSKTEEKETFFEEEQEQEKEQKQEILENTDKKSLKDSNLENKDTTIRQKPLDYTNIPYIDQKLKNMLTQYPPLLETQESYDTVNNWLLKISNNGYNEKEVEEVITHIGRLKEHNDIAEAAQLLLICGATESKYAQFMLARELFRGEILEKNLPEAFTLINRLAMDDDYPEAICDLAQFYENGVGIDKDKKRAEMLYKEAMELGVKRAAAHYERLHSANKSLFGKLFGK